MERLFKILAVILGGVAAFFWWRGSGDTAFIVGVLAAVSFFLSIRFHIKEKINDRQADVKQDSDTL